MLNAVRKIIPGSIKRVLRAYVDKRTKKRLFGSLADLVPRPEDMFDGPAGYAEFKRNGDEFLAIYRDVCHLAPDESMLDVGSGIGRKTIPLTQYLAAGALYEGLDVNQFGVSWCQERITPRFPAFHFRRANVRNGLYNAGGEVSAAEYRFPFPGETFSFVAVNSVFTHMTPDEIRHYLAEIHRVLRSGGRCLLSFFLLNDESRQALANGTSSLPFVPAGEGWASTSPERPEEAVALDERLAETFIANAGLKVAARHLGSWPGRSNALSYQDLIVATA